MQVALGVKTSGRRSPILLSRAPYGISLVTQSRAQRMTQPAITRLQSLVLRMVAGGKNSGQQIRAGLAASGVADSHPAFCELLGQLEEAELVLGEYRVISVDGRTVKRRDFFITGAGKRALEANAETCGQEKLATGPGRF
jgi:hypothetical protein